MPDLVSTRWIRVVGVAASIPVAWAMIAFAGSPWMAWMGLGWVVLAASGALWLVTRSSNRSVQELIADIEGQPAPALARAPIAPPATKTVL